MIKLFMTWSSYLWTTILYAIAIITLARSMVEDPAWTPVNIIYGTILLVWLVATGLYIAWNGISLNGRH